MPIKIDEGEVYVLNFILLMLLLYNTRTFTLKIHFTLKNRTNLEKHWYIP